MRFSPLWLLVSLCLAGALQARAVQSDTTFTRQDRVLILAPHPDDEILACGGIIQQTLTNDAKVRIVFLTNGDNNEWSFLVYLKHPVFQSKAARQMGLVRQAEALKAASILGLDSKYLTFLGYPDFGTLSIWLAHWGSQTPYRSMLTKATAVPYEDAFSLGAPYKGESILKDLIAVIKDYRPTKIFVSHPADHNPDHRALYLFARIALWEIGENLRCDLFPYLIHYPAWPKPQALHPDCSLLPPPELKSWINWKNAPLSNRQIETKMLALKEHHTQIMYSKNYLFSFVRKNELFGDFQPIALKPESAEIKLPNEPMMLSELFSPVDSLESGRDILSGIKWNYVKLETNSLTISTQITAIRPYPAAISFFLFSYRRDIPFAQMPKIRINLGELHYNVFDQNQRLRNDVIKVQRLKREILISIPLKLLGEPERILASAKSTLVEIPLDYIPWLVIELAMPSK